MLSDLLCVTQQAGGRAGPCAQPPGATRTAPGTFPCVHPLPCPKPELPGTASWSLAERCQGDCFTYSLIGSQRERRALSSSTRKESNLAFMAMVIGLILRRSFYFFINTVIRGLGSSLAAGPWGSSGLTGNLSQQPGLGSDQVEGLGMGEGWPGWAGQGMQCI